mgnify:CR=1 FL=1|tara:strand:- start:6711 stop:7169 length:459 start_codon:yes stop_codon:yes gene_type:complete
MWKWLLRLLGLGRDPATCPENEPEHLESEPLEAEEDWLLPDDVVARGWNRPPRRVVAYGRVVQVESQSEGSAAAADGQTLAIVSGSNGPKWLIMRCPCGCGETRRISLSKQVPPTWTLKVEPGPSVTLSPSVDLRSECRAHFILTRNRALVL